MYSEIFDRVYTVTTLDENEEAVENYSNVYVEVGIVGKTNGSVKGTFPDPLNPLQENAYIKGSSYATAYLTGMVVGGSVIKLPAVANQVITTNGNSFDYERQPETANDFVESVIVNITDSNPQALEFTTLVAL